MKVCSVCGTTEKELRPYGYHGASICFSCMKSDPALELEAEKNFGILLEAAESVSRVVIIGGQDGPVPL